MAGGRHGCESYDVHLSHSGRENSEKTREGKGAGFTPDLIAVQPQGEDEVDP
jgi:hypothetical protein